MICKICNEERESKFINEVIHKVGIEKGFENEDDALMTVPYCNDNNICTAIARMAKVLMKLRKR